MKRRGPSWKLHMAGGCSGNGHPGRVGSGRCVCVCGGAPLLVGVCPVASTRAGGGGAPHACLCTRGDHSSPRAPFLTCPPSIATASKFWVTVQKTEAAERCKLQGTYVLKASRAGLVLHDPHSGQLLYTWPYRLLRRYGRDKVGGGVGRGRGPGCRLQGPPSQSHRRTTQGPTQSSITPCPWAQKERVVLRRATLPISCLAPPGQGRGKWAGLCRRQQSLLRGGGTTEVRGGLMSGNGKILPVLEGGSALLKEPCKASPQSRPRGVKLQKYGRGEVGAVLSREGGPAGRIPRHGRTHRPHQGRPLQTDLRWLRLPPPPQVMFSFEAGRRCESGPGNFTFETNQGNEIFRVVEEAIQEQKAQAEEDRQSGGSLDSEASGAGHLHSAMAGMLLLEGEGPRSTPAGATLSLATEEKEGAASPLKGQGRRDPLPQRPNTPPCSPLLGLAGHLQLPSEDTGSVYSEPLDAVKAAPRHRPDPLYADPLDSRRGEAELGRTGSLYERVGPVPSGGCQGQQGAGGHIYDEPEGRAPRPTPAPIYDEAHLPCEAWRTQGMERRAGYELPYQPGDGDYAVPAFPQNPGVKPSKPSPAPKPPRMHKKAPPLLDRAPPHNNGCSNSNNNNHHQPHQEGEPLYSRVLKPPNTPCPTPARREQSVDESRPASVYEDLGEI